MRQLLVFAHRDEASAFTDVPHLVTGVGKVNASAQLAAALQAAQQQGQPVTDVIVLGTAGIVGPGHDLDTIVQVTRAVQHDFSLPSPPLSFGRRAPGGPGAVQTATIATGDQFVTDDAQRARIASLGATLVDMEVYAYAAICEAFGVALQVYKIPSDFADSQTTDAEWDDIVFLKSTQLREFYNQLGGARGR